MFFSTIGYNMGTILMGKIETILIIITLIRYLHKYLLSTN